MKLLALTNAALCLESDINERMSFCTLLDVFRRGKSLSDRNLFSISSQFLSLSLNNILEPKKQKKNEGKMTVTVFPTKWVFSQLHSSARQCLI